MSRLRQIIDKLRFSGSGDYWERRYAAGGTSGDGSYGDLAAYKAKILNDFVAEHQVRSVIEFGSGDGNQVGLATYPDYLGLDVSRTAVDRCSQRFADDPTRSFAVYDPNNWSVVTAELALSLDVIYHLVEDAVFETHIRHLFSAATRYVIIYASDDTSADAAAHVKNRHFTPYVEQTQPDWSLCDHIVNPLRAQDPSAISDFFIYQRVAAA
jgi:hypothetical protein